MTIKKKTIMLIDGTYYLYRAYYAYPLLMNQHGEHTGAIYGIINMLFKLLKVHHPKNIIIIFDSNKHNFRTRLYKNYKSNRIPMPQILKKQIPPIINIIHQLGISTLKIPNIEADDIIGTLSNIYALNNYKVLISSNDKDLAQLVSSNIYIINVHDQTILNSNDITKKYGVKPQFIADWLGLMGDSSDNIPGVPGIGKKKATILVQHYGSIYNIYNNINDIKNLPIKGAKKISNIILENKKIAFLSYKLTKIKTDISIDINTINPILKTPNITKLTKLFNQYNFKYLKKIFNYLIYESNNHNCNHMINDKNHYHKNTLNNIKNYTITSISIIQFWFNKLKKTDLIAIYIDFEDNNAISIGIATNAQKSIFISLKSIHYNNNFLFNQKEIFSYLKLLLEDKKITKVSFNLKKYLKFFKKYNIQFFGTNFDVMLEAYINDGAQLNTFKNVLSQYLNSTIDIKLNIPQDQLNSGHKAHIILQLHHQLWNIIQKDNKKKTIFNTIDMPLIPIIASMEYHGIAIDTNILQQQSKHIHDNLLNLTQLAYKHTESPFNLSSNKEIQNILFNKFNLKDINKTKIGNSSTNKFVLMKLSKHHELPKIILKYRSLFKFKNTYLDILPKMVNSKTGKLHTTYHQNSTLTGRLSSKKPNLQNIPIRHEIGKQIRKAFIPSFNYMIISADYSQIELRIMAHLSRDPKLKKYFFNQEDIHTITATAIFNVQKNEVSHKQRQYAKTINFALIYGVTPFGLSKQLQISYSESKKYIFEYFNKYTEIFNYIQASKKKARLEGYVSTLHGRKIYINNINSKNPNIQKSAERQAVNYIIQGTAADIIKIAMIRINHWLLKHYPNEAKIIMQVHDELIFEIKHSHVTKIKKNIEYLMEQNMPLDIPIKVNIKNGKNWYDLQS
ncbi:MAG: DNA polymerase I [Buchnera aphidicola (Eriosoma harunire)]